MEQKYYLYGASGHAKVVADVVQSEGLRIKMIVDDHPQVPTICGIAVVHTNAIELNEKQLFLIAIGNNQIRKNIAANKGLVFFKAMHQAATVSTYATVASGTVVMAQAVINAGAQIGTHCIINTASVIEHDCVLSDFVHVSPNAALAGNVRVGEGSHIGIGACIIQGISIGKWVTVGAGAVVITDVPDYAVVVGNPAKVIKYNYPDIGEQ